MPKPEHSRTRVILLVIAVIVGLGVAAIPLFAGIFSDAGSGSGSHPNNASDIHATHDSAAGAPVGSAGEGSRGGSGQDRAGRDGGEGGVHKGEGEQLPAEMKTPIACPGEGTRAGGNPQLSPDSELSGIELPCLTDGRADTRDLGAALAGKPTVINVWAWWCEPCRAELPHLNTLAKQHPEWNVVGVHLDRKAQAGADLLSDLGVGSFPAFQDGGHTFDSATQLPQVVPITIVYHTDGTRARMYPQVFREYDELENAVHQALSGED